MAAGPALIVSVRGEGLFRLEAGHAEPWAPLASAWAAKNRVFASEALGDGRLVFGSLLGGALVLSADGGIDQLIDSRFGLADDFVSGLAVDGEGALWLALDSGVVRAEVSSPLTLIDRRSGLPGSVQSFTRHAGRLYAGTSAGLFVSSGRREGADPGSPTLHFEPVAGLDVPIWGLEPLGERAADRRRVRHFRAASKMAGWSRCRAPKARSATFSSLRGTIPGGSGSAPATASACCARPSAG